MPRAPSQKLNHSSTATAHPYAINNNSGTSQSVPSSSASGAHSPHFQQHRLNNPPPHMSTLRPPQPSHDAQHDFDREKLHYREDDSGSRLKQQRTSPVGTPLTRSQSLDGKSVLNHGNNQMSLGQDVMVKVVRNGTSLSTESSRAPQNGNAPSSVPPITSTSGSSSAPTSNTGSSMGVSGGPAPKKKHVCPTCDRAFTTSGHLARHARVHTGERNHKCPFPGCETRCSRQDNLQQHYRIHLSPGSRRSSSSATRAAIQRACAKPVTAASATTSPPDLDSPPPLAQATFPAVHLSQSHVQYAVIHQPYPPTSTLSQAHVPASHVTQHSYHPQTPPVSNGQIYENSNTTNDGVSADTSQGYSHGRPDSPAEHSGPASTTPSADASPVISGNTSVTPAAHPYPTQHQTYIYVQHPGYYTHAHPSHGSQAPTASAAVYSTPPPSSGLDGQYPSQPQISTFYQQHHYPREAYINPTQGSTAPLAQASSSYVAEVADTQNAQGQTYTEPPRVKVKRRGRPSDASVANEEQSPSDSPIITNAQGQTGNRPTGQGQSNVYTYYGMAAPPSAGGATAPPGGSTTGAPSPSAPSHSNSRYSINGNGSGFGQFQLHTPPPPPPPPPLTSSSTVTTASSVSYASTPGSYSSQNIETNGGAANGNGTHSPPPVLAPIQQKRPSYSEALPNRYSYPQHASPSGYASMGKDYPE